MKFLKYGISTGACAAAAAKAAALALMGVKTDKVSIPTPIGLRLEVPVEGCRRIDDERAVAWVVKDPGDDVDVTRGLKIHATVRLTRDGEIVIKGGEGIGVVTKPGLPVPVGEAAINPVPRMMIKQALQEVLPPGIGAEVLIEVPGGDEVAKRTLNPKLGIIGGISILGTTGIVKPHSTSAYKRSLSVQVDVALANGHDRIVIVPGNVGARVARQLLKIPDEAIVQAGDFIGYMLRKAVEKGVKEILLVGHAGKLVKIAAGIFNTHHKVADARMEVIAAYAAAAGADNHLVKRILEANTTEEAIKLLQLHGILKQTFNMIADRARSRCIDLIDGRANVGIIIVSLEGEVLGVSGVDRWLSAHG
ncbi:MAG: cobalt-precorrin-5B (C(1))-methyltransferase CbiD [Candidatus Nezhaarchaeales archaeon]